VVADYDKYINPSFFGIGSGAAFAERETYTREPLDISVTLGRGFSPRVVGQARVRSKTVRNSRFAQGSRLRDLAPIQNAGRVSYVSVLSNWRWDSRPPGQPPGGAPVARAVLGWAKRKRGYGRAGSLKPEARSHSESQGDPWRSTSVSRWSR
jgi:hypothetical protein